MKDVQDRIFQALVMFKTILVAGESVAVATEIRRLLEEALQITEAHQELERLRKKESGDS